MGVLVFYSPLYLPLELLFALTQNADWHVGQLDLKLLVDALAGAEVGHDHFRHDVVLRT